MEARKLVVIIMWLIAVYAWWGFIWAGWAETMWERIKDQAWRVRAATVFGIPWTREYHVRRARLVASIAAGVMTLVAMLVLR